MARAAKDYEYLHCKIERPLAEQLSLYADETRRPKTSVVEMALQKLFDEEAKNSDSLQLYRRVHK